MKKMICFCIIFFLYAKITVVAQDTAMMRAWQNFMTPGPAHKMMAQQTGTWTAEVSQWMDPAAPPTKATATNIITMTYNGLYQISNFSATMMGRPMKGQATSGYDNGKKEYFSTWIDNMGSGIILLRGNFDEATKKLSLKGMQTDPITGGDTEIREEIQWVNKDTYIQTMYGAGMDGKEMKFMEGTFKRKK
jgi:hypothetical protein